MNGLTFPKIPLENCCFEMTSKISNTIVACQRGLKNSAVPDQTASSDQGLLCLLFNSDKHFANSGPGNSQLILRTEREKCSEY